MTDKGKDCGLTWTQHTQVLWRQQGTATPCRLVYPDKILCTTLSLPNLTPVLM